MFYFQLKCIIPCMRIFWHEVTWEKSLNVNLLMIEFDHLGVTHSVTKLVTNSPSDSSTLSHICLIFNQLVNFIQSCADKMSTV